VSAARISLRGLYAITPETGNTYALLARVEACLAGGAALVQYRAKDLARDVALEQARAIAQRCRDHGALCIVNDSAELAREALADGVHLGRDDAGAQEVRRDWPEAVIGVSCYAEPGRARDAAAAGADYVAIGSVFASPTKPAAVRAPLHLLRQAADMSNLPVAAIGGITLANAQSAIEAGADMVAVLSALFDAPDVEAAARAFRQLFAAPHGALHVRA
jgi:thiamine-phosphate pyrophosphorylase